MPTGQSNRLIQYLRKVTMGHDGGVLTDAQLLDAFLAEGDNVAFEVLVRRHGPMVLSVCRRVLRNAHDADDAFQATFLVLIRKAASIGRRELLANWLFGVAYRTALEARKAVAKRKAKEEQAGKMPRTETRDDFWGELLPLLDQELNRLPDQYRVPVVLCDLEGKTGKEAARLLGWPEGTLATRLRKARALLAKRLARRGLAVSAGALAAALPQDVASASVPSSLLTATVEAAAATATGSVIGTSAISAQVWALTQGVLKTMFLAKLKLAVVMMLALAVVGAGTGLVAYQLQAAEQTETREAKVKAREAAEQTEPQEAKVKAGERQGNDKRSKEAFEALVEVAEAQVELARAQLDVAKAQMEEAAADVRSAESDVDFRKATFGRIEKLRAEGSITEGVADEAKTAFLKAQHLLGAKKVAYLVAQAKVRVAQAQVRVAEAQAKLARVQP
jgi:RNA polymerase sigma factor (sigma-70 family)